MYTIKVCLIEDKTTLRSGKNAKNPIKYNNHLTYILKYVLSKIRQPYEVEKKMYS
jgi:hypothetical protein